MLSDLRIAAQGRFGVDHLDGLITLLKRDERRNINVLNFISANPVLGSERIGNSVMVRGKSDRSWIYVSSTRRDELETLAEKLGAQDDHFAAVEEWMVPILSRGKEMVWNLSMMQFILPDDVIVPEPDVEIRPLSVEDAVYVYENSEYKAFISPEYVKNRILGGENVAIQEDGQLVAWAMTQDDGAMGFLHVLEGYRKKGYGYNVTLALIRELRRQNKRPFAYIEEENRPAIKLISKLGFEKDKKVYWFQIG
jgi:ribosomal protein S18 acetylase RimI-like enzyme